MGRHEIPNGADTFFQSYCAGGVEDLRAALLKEERLCNLPAGSHLCRKGEPADCVWIVESGHLDIASDQPITTRCHGSLIGEASFFRIDAEAHFRGADIVARTRSKVWRIDRSAIDALPTDLRLIWTEAVARVLVEKLDEALAHRAQLTTEADQGDQLFGRFVCPEGVETAQAAARRGRDAIPVTRKQVIVWFCDIAGFSSYSEKLLPDEVGNQLRRVMNPVAEQIVRHGGQIDKFMGDGMMAFWLCRDQAHLAAVANEAVMAALESAHRFVEIAADAGLPLDIRIGLHAGEAALGDFGGHDRIAFTLIGDTVNSAARYEQYLVVPGAPYQGRVRISDALRSHLSNPDTVAQFNAEPIRFPDKHGREFVAYLSLD